jgi:zinc D-Ala-D-Ala carboxypeptidase
MPSSVARALVGAAIATLTVGTLSVAPAAADRGTTKPASIAAIRDCVDVANRDVGMGSSGAYVREVQCLLNWAVHPGTYHYIDEDGQFGPDTRGKVIKFQQCANALGAGLRVDGRVGPRTAPHLEWWAASSGWIC